jgi:hypothetical protein
MLNPDTLLGRLLPAGAAGLVLLAGQPPAQSSAADGTSIAGPSKDKKGYNLFHPTPPDLMRELSTDRPDKTESPYTVDAGHFQWEMDFTVFTLEREDGARSHTWNIAPANLKAGLTNNADLQLFFDSYIHERVEDQATGLAETADGVGNLTTRLKINLWGNDGGTTAFAVMPFVTVPTNSQELASDAIEGGVIFPIAIELPGGWGMGAQTEVDFRRNGSERGYRPEFINSVTFSHDIAGKLGGYLEFFSNVSTERGSPWVGTVDFGLTYALAKNIQLDGGCNIGVTRSADDLQLFTGITLRF